VRAGLLRLLNNPPQINPGGLFSKTNLQTLPVSGLDDGFDFCVYESKGRSGFLFGNGLPPSESAFRDRLSDTGIQGFHAFRRFRTTWLRKNRVQEDLIRFWCGHSEKSVTDGYSKLSEDVEYRREVAENIGIGFNL
jgi:hypothetical protein